MDDLLREEEEEVKREAASKASTAAKNKKRKNKKKGVVGACICVCVHVCLKKRQRVCAPVSACLWNCLIASVCVSIYLSVYLSGCWSVCLSVYLSVCLAICQCVYVCIYVYAYECTAHISYKNKPERRTYTHSKHTHMINTSKIVYSTSVSLTYYVILPPSLSLFHSRASYISRLSLPSTSLALSSTSFLGLCPYFPLTISFPSAPPSLPFSLSPSPIPLSPLSVPDTNHDSDADAQQQATPKTTAIVSDIDDKLRASNTHPTFASSSTAGVAGGEDSNDGEWETFTEDEVPIFENAEAGNIEMDSSAPPHPPHPSQPNFHPAPSTPATTTPQLNLHPLDLNQHPGVNTPSNTFMNCPAYGFPPCPPRQDTLPSHSAREVLDGAKVPAIDLSTWTPDFRSFFVYLWIVLKIGLSVCLLVWLVVCLWRNTCICEYMYQYIYLCLYIYVYIYTHMFIYICICICSYIYAYIYIYIHRYIDLSIYIYVYVSATWSWHVRWHVADTFAYIYKNKPPHSGGYEVRCLEHLRVFM